MVLYGGVIMNDYYYTVHEFGVENEDSFDYLRAIFDIENDANNLKTLLEEREKKRQNYIDIVIKLQSGASLEEVGITKEKYEEILNTYLGGMAHHQFDVRRIERNKESIEEHYQTEPF